MLVTSAMYIDLWGINPFFGAYTAEQSFLRARNSSPFGFCAPYTLKAFTSVLSQGFLLFNCALLSKFERQWELRKYVYTLNKRIAMRLADKE